MRLSYKIRFEIEPDGEEEIVIRCKKLDGEALRMESIINRASASIREMELHLNGNDYFISIEEILFFEANGNKTAAHTKNRMYYTDLKLYELEEQLPRSFMRISKSCVLNLNAVSSLRRELTGICEADFRDTPKKVYISRSYYKPFREAINEIRLNR